MSGGSNTPQTQHLNQVFSRSSKNFLLAKKKDARQRFSSLKDQEINTSITAGYTPEDKRLEPENTGPLEKENHLPNHHFQVLC